MFKFIQYTQSQYKVFLYFIYFLDTFVFHSYDIVADNIVTSLFQIIRSNFTQCKLLLFALNTQESMKKIINKLSFLFPDSIFYF